MIPLSESEIIDQIKVLEGHAKQIKDEVFRLTWHMRGGVSSHELMWIYSVEDREIISAIVSEHIELTNKTGIPLV